MIYNEPKNSENADVIPILRGIDTYIGDTDDSLTLAAYLAEKQKDEISLKDLLGLDEGIEIDTPAVYVCITVTPEEHKQINKIFTDFITAPLEYDLSEMMSEKNITEMVKICEELRKELYDE